MAFGLASSLVACESPEAVASTCSLAKGQVVAHRDGLRFHDLKLVPLLAGTAGAAPGPGAQLAALWSDSEGLWLRRLSSDGSPIAPAVRLADSCAGGIDALPTSSGLTVACARPFFARGPDATLGPDGNSALGELRVYRMSSEGKPGSDLPIGTIGRDGRGVSLSSEGTRVNVVYHEGSVGRHVIHRVVLEGERVVSSQEISDPRRVAGRPMSFVDHGHHYATWSESELSAEPNKRASLWIKRDDDAPRRVLETSVLEATPSLSRDGQDLVLSFRDQRPRDKRTELYVARLSKTLALQDSALRVGRANGEGSPRLARCGSLHAAVVPREYGGEHYVAVHELDARLGNLGGGHQYYANTREFVLASATCAEPTTGALTLLIGERANPAKPGIDLMTLRFSCR